jgi:hypothetical protein
MINNISTETVPSFNWSKAQQAEFGKMVVFNFYGENEQKEAITKALTTPGEDAVTHEYIDMNNHILRKNSIFF